MANELENFSISPDADKAEEVQRLIKVEDEKVKRVSISEELEEVRKQRHEILEKLNLEITMVESQLGVDAARLEKLTERRNNLLQMEAAQGKSSLVELRKIKREVNNTHLELMKEDVATQISEGDKRVLSGGLNLANVSFGRMFKLGLAFALPLMIVILLAVIILALSFIYALGV